MWEGGRLAPGYLTLGLLLGRTIRGTIGGTSARGTGISDKANSQRTSSNQSDRTSVNAKALELRIKRSSLASQRTLEDTSLLLQLGIQRLNLTINRSHKLLQARDVELRSQTHRNQEQ